MQPKTAIIILLILAVITASGLLFLYSQYQQKLTQEQNQKIQEMAEKQKITQEEKMQIQEIVSKINLGKPLSETEAKQLDQEVNKVVAEKSRTLSEKPLEEKQAYGYSQSELEFIANPEKTAQQELGIKVEKPPVKFYSSEELEKIANPGQ